MLPHKSNLYVFIFRFNVDLINNYRFLTKLVIMIQFNDGSLNFGFIN